MIRVIFKINAFTFILNVLLYCEPALGMYFQIVLGTMQLLFALILTFNISKFIKRLSIFLIIYWLLAVADLTALAVLISYGDVEILHMGLINFIAFPISMCIAAHFVYITYLVSKSNRENGYI